MQISDEMLLPCPFCNSAPNPVPQNGDVPLPGGNGYFQTIWCERCGAEGGKRKTEADAIEAWNRRAALSLPVQPVADYLADWSNLPKDIFVVSAKSYGGVAFDVTCCSVPMITAPEVHYTRADLVKAPVQPAYWIVTWPGKNQGVHAAYADIDEAKHAAENIANYSTKKTETAIVPLYAEPLTTPPVPPTKGPEDDLIAALERVKALVVGDRAPNWNSDTAVTQSRMRIADICDLALRSRPASALPVVGEAGKLAPGCCSAISPCSHQRHDPRSICDTCRAALIPSVQP